MRTLLFVIGNLASLLGFAQDVMPLESRTGGMQTPSAFLEEVRPALLAVDLRRSTEGRELSQQLALMTNILHCVTSTNCSDEADVDAGSTLLKWVLAFPAVKNDEGTLLYFAQEVSKIRGPSTNEYARELKIACDSDLKLRAGETRTPGTVAAGRYWGPNRRAFEARWSPVLEQSRLSEELRSEGIDAFRRALEGTVRDVDMLQVARLIESLSVMQSLTPEERKRIVGQLVIKKAE